MRRIYGANFMGGHYCHTVTLLSPLSLSLSLLLLASRVSQASLAMATGCLLLFALALMSQRLPPMSNSERADGWGRFVVVVAGSLGALLPWR